MTANSFIPRAAVTSSRRETVSATEYGLSLVCTPAPPSEAGPPTGTANPEPSMDISRVLHLGGVEDPRGTGTPPLSAHFRRLAVEDGAGCQSAWNDCQSYGRT